MTAASEAARPEAPDGHCRVTVVAPTRRVDMALPADVPLAELLPELLRLAGAPVPPATAAALNGYVLTGLDGTPLDTAAALSEQGILHGGILHLRPATALPEATVHDDIADAVAEAVLAGGTQWTAKALRITALTVVAVAATLGAVVLWFSNTGTLHGWKGLLAGAITILLFSLGVLRARYDPNAVGRGSYYGYAEEPGPDPQRRGPARSVPAARLQAATRVHARYDDAYAEETDPYDEPPYRPDPGSHYSPDLGPHYGRDRRYAFEDSAESFEADFGPGPRRTSDYDLDWRSDFDSSPGYTRDPDYGTDPRSDWDHDPGRDSRAAYSRDPDYGQDRRRDFDGPTYGRDPRSGYGGDPDFDQDRGRDSDGSDYGRDPRGGYRGDFDQARRRDSDGSDYGRDPRGGYRGDFDQARRRDPDSPAYGRDRRGGYRGDFEQARRRDTDGPAYGRDPRSDYRGDPDFARERHRDLGRSRDSGGGYGRESDFDRDRRRDFGPDSRSTSDSRSGRDPRPSASDRSRDPRTGHYDAPPNSRDARTPDQGSDPRFGPETRSARDPRDQQHPAHRPRLLSRHHPQPPDFAAPSATFDLSSFGADRAPGTAPRTIGATTVAHATASVRTGGLGGLAAWPTVAEAMAWATGAHHERDYAAASVLIGSSLPYAFVAGAGVIPTHGLGRVHFTAGAIAVLIVALAAIVGLGRRVAVPVAGATVGAVAALAGIGLQLTKASPVAGTGVVTAVCALAVELLPFAAMAAARFVIEPPTSGVEPGEFDGAPVNNYTVGLRVARTLDTLNGLTAGTGILLVLSVALLVIPLDAMQTSAPGVHAVWEQGLALTASAVVLCRARLFRERIQVLAMALSGLAGLVIGFACMARNAEPVIRGLWLAPLLVVITLLALGLATIRPRRGTTEPILPPRWSRAVDLIENTLFLAVLPILMAVLGVYGHVRDFKG